LKYPLENTATLSITSCSTYFNFKLSLIVLSVNNSTTIKAKEKVGTDLESLELKKMIMFHFYDATHQILLTKHSHQFLLTDKLFTLWNIPIVGWTLDGAGRPLKWPGPGTDTRWWNSGFWTDSIWPIASSNYSKLPDCILGFYQSQNWVSL
jgi:hypothetical protein